MTYTESTMLKLTDRELLADYFAHVDAVVRSVTRGDMLRAKAEAAELVVFLEKYPRVSDLVGDVSRLASELTAEVTP